MSLGENIKSIRESKNITLESFAQLTGISADNCLKIESGQRALTSAEIQSICNVLGITFDDLVRSPKQPQQPEPRSQDASVLMPVDELQKLLGKMK